MRSWRRILPVLSAAVVAVLLAGCAGLATNRGVEPGLPVSGGNPPRLGYVPPGPQPDGTPESIIRGFIRAGSASDGDYSVAQLFLTQQAATAWEPDGDVVVFSTSAQPQYKEMPRDQWRLTVSTDATVTADGRYRPATGETSLSAYFGLVKQDGQWRIDRLPKGFGRWVETGDVGRLFRTYAVNYLSAVDGSLVPDMRWFPNDHLSTRLAAAQIAEVPAYLKRAVSTAFPADASLRVGSVTVADSLATVDLSGTFSPDSKLRRGVWTQLAATLLRLPDVYRVTVQVDGSVLDFPGRPTSNGSTLADLGADGERAPAGLPVFRTGSTLRQVDLAASGGLTTVAPDSGAQKSLPSIDPTWHDLAVSRNATEVAGIDPARTVVGRWVGGHEYEVPLTATLIGRPAYDVRGWLWLPAVGARAEDRLWAVDTAADPADASAAKARPIEVPWLSGRVVTAISLPLDGQRVAVISTDGAGRGARLDVAGVVRDQAGRPASLAAPLRLGPQLDRAIDVSWTDETAVAALGVAGTGQAVVPLVASLGGDVAMQSPVTAPTSIGTTGGARDLVVTTSSGRVLARSGTVWSELGKGTDFTVPAD